MQSFLEEVVYEVCQKYDTLEDVIFVLPSKRAGSFLKKILADSVSRTQFAPAIFSIEEFVEGISGLAIASNTELLFELYATYAQSTEGKKDSFLEFSKWGTTLLADFNEIDRYLVKPDKIFSYLSAIKELDHWYLNPDKTQNMKDYVQFWNTLEHIYQQFTSNLLDKGLGYQGLIYRWAVNGLSTYLGTKKNKAHIFLGFNALNASESHIIQTILATGRADVYWDTDSYFIDDPIHDAGYFIRQHATSWKYLQDKSLNGISQHFQTKKTIQIVGVPKKVSQAKYVAQLLKKLQRENTDLLKKAAVVLGDETMLNPILNSIPEEIERANITMGYPLAKTSLAGFFNHYFELYLRQDPKGWFYKGILSFLSNSYIQQMLVKNGENHADQLKEEIIRRNLVYLSPVELESLSGGFQPVASLLFCELGNNPELFLENCLQLVDVLRLKFQEDDNPLDMEYLFRFHALFHQMKDLLGKYPFIDHLKSLHSLYLQLISIETVDFQGEPMQGLQIMGMLESRNLDFETVIITSVNEGILPSGKSNNSFIPFHVKKDFLLPTYKEKDAVYTYHFYRLLQRAKNIFILYNTEPDVLEGGEKSRLITQLITDDLKSKEVKHIIASAKILPSEQTGKSIKKDENLIEVLKSKALNGFSPTSLTNYIRNPLDFYKKTVLGIDDAPEIEETVEARTFGTIIHNALEELYQPLIGTYLSQELLKVAKQKVVDITRSHFSKSYAGGNISEGKNLIIYRVVVRYLENFLDREIEESKSHKIKILALERKVDTILRIPQLDFPVSLKGTVDRIDEKDGVLRIIDYKTGYVKSSHVEIVDWPEIINDYEYSKAFQLLCYALMYSENNSMGPFEAGILSFKNMQAGLLPFATKEKKGSRKKTQGIKPETLVYFKEQLQNLILEIFDPAIPFTEKEV